MKIDYTRIKSISHKGFTLSEVIIAISLFSLLIIILFQMLLFIRERGLKWDQEINLDQEALRFFTYFQDRNVSTVSWSLPNSQSVIINTCELKNSRPIRRQFYRYGNVIIERDLEYGGIIIVSHLVDNLLFQPLGSTLKVELTLKDGELVKTYSGLLVRRIPSCS